MSSALLLALRRAGAHGGAPTPPPPPPPPAPTLLWSDPATWPGTGVPQAGDSPVITDKEVIYDLATPIPYGRIRVGSGGWIKVDATKDTQLVADDIVVDGGRYTAGSPTAKLQYRHTVTVAGARANDTQAVNTPASATSSTSTRHIMVMNGGELGLHGATPAVLNTQLGEDAPAGQTFIKLKQPMPVRVGDVIVVTSTDFWGLGSSQRFTVTVDNSASPDTITFFPATLAHKKRGRIEYVTDAGMSETYAALTDADAAAAVAAGAPAFVDNRAHVCLLSRNITLQSVADADWSTHGFGVHTMCMDLLSKYMLDGVRLNRCGQAGVLGRYPVHDHMRSYTRAGVAGSGTYLGDVDPAFNFQKNCATTDSTNHGVTTHGTCGKLIEGNSFHNIDTHCWLVENGSERRNVFRGNVVAKVNPINTVVSAGKSVIKSHDTSLRSTSGPGTTGPAGAWFTNPDNTLEDNVFSECDIGIWNSFTNTQVAGYPWSFTGKGCFGESRDAAVDPGQLDIRSHKNNKVTGCRLHGMVTGAQVVDEAGNVANVSTYMGADFDTLQTFEKVQIIKCGALNNQGGYFNQINKANYKSWTVAANKGQGLRGVANTSDTGGGIESPLFVGYLIDDDAPSVDDYRNMQASYHDSINSRDGIYVNVPESDLTFDGVRLRGSGVLEAWDFYLKAAQRQFVNMARNAFLGTVYPGFRVPPPFKEAEYTGVNALITARIAAGDASRQANRNWSLAGALKVPANGWLFNKLMGGNYGGWNWVYDDQFLLFGTTGSVYVASARYPNLNGKLVNQDFYGVEILTDAKAQRLDAINVSRRSADPAGSVVGTWNVPDGNVSTQLGIFRGFCAMAGGWYEVSYPNDGAVRTTACFQLGGLNLANGESFYLGLPYAGGTAVNTCALSTTNGYTSFNVAAGYSVRFAAVASLALLKSATAPSYWQDAANNRVWVKCFSGNTGATGGVEDPAKAALDPRSEPRVLKESVMFINNGAYP